MKRVHIERLELDLRGLPRHTAESIGHGIGPAVRQALRPSSNEGQQGTKTQAGAVTASIAARIVAAINRS